MAMKKVDLEQGNVIQGKLVKDIPEDINEYLAYDEAVASGLVWIKKPTSTSNSIKVGQMAGKRRKTGHFDVWFRQKVYFAHRIIWFLHYGPIPYGMQVDHKFGAYYGNQISNLRLATTFQNAANAKLRSDSFSGLRGANYCKRDNLWYSQISANGKKLRIGTFENKYLAYAAYCDKALELHGEFARLF